MPEGYPTIWVSKVPVGAEISMGIPLRIGRDLAQMEFNGAAISFKREGEILNVPLDSHPYKVLYFLRCLSETKLLATCVGWEVAGPIVEWWYGRWFVQVNPDFDTDRVCISYVPSWENITGPWHHLLVLVSSRVLMWYLLILMAERLWV